MNFFLVVNVRFIDDSTLKSYKLYSQSYVFWLSFFTTPYLGGVIIAINYYRLGEKKNFRRALVISLVCIVYLACSTHLSTDGVLYKWSGFYSLYSSYAKSISPGYYSNDYAVKFLVNVFSILNIVVIQTILQGRQLRKHGREGGRFVSLI